MRDYLKERILKIFILFFSLIFSSSLYAQIPEGTNCDECGMKVDPSSRFASYIITMDGKKLFFCDIGDMLNNLKKKGYEPKEVFVRDYKSWEWIDGKKAYYVHNKKLSTPMEWGIAVFKNISEAESLGSPTDFNNAFKLIK